MYGQLEPVSLAVVLAFTAVFLAAAIYAYNPSKGLLARRGGPAEEEGDMMSGACEVHVPHPR